MVTLKYVFVGSKWLYAKADFCKTLVQFVSFHNNNNKKYHILNIQTHNIKKKKKQKPYNPVQTDIHISLQMDN